MKRFLGKAVFFSVLLGDFVYYSVVRIIRPESATFISFSLGQAIVSAGLAHFVIRLLKKVLRRTG